MPRVLSSSWSLPLIYQASIREGCPLSGSSFCVSDRCVTPTPASLCEDEPNRGRGGKRWRGLWTRVLEYASSSSLALIPREDSRYQEGNCLEEILKNTSTFSQLFNCSALILILPAWESLRAGKGGRFKTWEGYLLFLLVSFLFHWAFWLNWVLFLRDIFSQCFLDMLSFNLKKS